MDAGRRLKSSNDQKYFYMEKPEGAVWTTAPWLLNEGLGTSSLKGFWDLPGRVEVSLSASHTDTIFQPFVLYYRSRGSEKFPRDKIEGLVRNALAEAVPMKNEVSLPDGSKMTELHHDENGVMTTSRRIHLGEVVEFRVPEDGSTLQAYFADSGEAWVSTDTGHIQQALLGNINTEVSQDTCKQGASGGYAALPGSFMPILSGFSQVTISIHNLETGLLTTCGYYPQ
jgi:hypothetical protein